MSCYTSSDEEKIRTQAMVREWARSGLLDETQAARMSEDLRVDLRRTNPFLRAVLFLFTVLIVAASIVLFAVTFKIDDREVVAGTCLVSALICYVLAEIFIRQFRAYRFGVEEALAVCAVLLLCIAAIATTDRMSGSGTLELTIITGLITGVVGAAAVYWRFGFLYAALAAMMCVAALPFQFRLSLPVERGSVAAIFLLIFLLARIQRRSYADDFPGDDYGWIQAVAVAGLYLDLNLQLTASAVTGRFYWVTYTLIWLIPVFALAAALRDRDRPLLDVSLASALATVATNKPYLGLQRQPWDPIIFGVFLVIVAIVVRRWLSKPADHERFGFTSQRILMGDRRLMTAVGTASAVLQSGVASHSPAASKAEFHGGRSGGAGASGSF